MTRAVVCGLAGYLPLGGMGMHYLQYCLGLRDIGVDVLYLEDNGAWPYHPYMDDPDPEASYTIPWLRTMFGSFDIPWSYLAPNGEYHGWPEPDARAWCRSADIVLNVSGGHQPKDHHRAAGVLAYLDTDPGFVQVGAASAEPRALQWLGAHDILFTFAESINRPGCRIPTAGLRWLPTRQPIDLPFWSEVVAPPGPAYSTVMQWRSYEPTEWEGDRWGQKDAEFPLIQELPARVRVPLEIALGGPSAPREELTSLGWRLVDSRRVTSDIWAYRDFIASSRGELSVAKQAYVRSRGGWFSERSANYLAAGRPVIAQDTGWSAHIPSGAGVFAFNNIDEAEEALRKVEAEPVANSAAARGLAAAYFDAKLVVGQLLSDAAVN